MKGAQEGAIRAKQSEIIASWVRRALTGVNYHRSELPQKRSDEGFSGEGKQEQSFRAGMKAGAQGSGQKLPMWH